MVIINEKTKGKIKEIYGLGVVNSYTLLRVFDWSCPNNDLSALSFNQKIEAIRSVKSEVQAAKKAEQSNSPGQTMSF